MCIRDSYYGTTVEFNATVKNAPRIDSEIKFTNKTYTYTSNYEAMREKLFNTLIDWKGSTLPSSDKIGKDYYTIAVSYTHLDVYKRQAEVCFAILMRYLRNCLTIRSIKI